jgi:hypothetical protein
VVFFATWLFLFRIPTKRGKYLLASVLAMIGALYVFSDVLWPSKKAAVADLKQTSGVVESSRLDYEHKYRWVPSRRRNPLFDDHKIRSPFYNHRVLLKLRGSNETFAYVAEPWRLDEVSRVVGANAKISHFEDSTSVWGLEINGVVVATPEQRNAREQKATNSVRLFNLGLLAVAALIGLVLGARSHSRKQSPLASSTESDLSTGSADTTSVETSRRSAPALQNQRTQTMETLSNPPVPASSTQSIRKQTVAEPTEHRRLRKESRRLLEGGASEKLLIQAFSVPVGILWGLIVVRWYWSTQLPKTELGFGGIAYAFIALFVFMIAYAIAAALLHLVAHVFQSTTRAGVLVIALVGSFLALLTQQQRADEQKRQRDALDRVAIAAIQEREQRAKQLEKDAERERAERPEREFQEALARIPAEMGKVVQHAPPGEIPPMLEVEPDGETVKITNRANHFVEVRISRALKTARTWERCTLWAPINSDPKSPTVTTAGLTAGESKFYKAKCHQRFSDGALEFVVGNGNFKILFKSDSAFYPWDPATR